MLSVAPPSRHLSPLGRLRGFPSFDPSDASSESRRKIAVNQDIDLGSLDDIRLYLYYTDFTVQ